MFLNPASNCLVETDSFLPEGLARVRIFCRCYSLVLNVGHPEIDCAWGSSVIAHAIVIVGTAVAAAAAAVVAAVVVAAVVVADPVLLASHKGSLCCMFLQTAMFSNFRMGMVVATQNGVHS